MQDQDLDRIVEKWVDEETLSAPEMRPTAEMYESVVSLGRRRSLGWFVARRAVWSTALAVMVFFVLAAAAIQAIPWQGIGWGQQAAQVSLRPAFAPESGQPRGGLPPKGKGPRGAAPPFRELVFQFQGIGASAVRSVDLLASPPPRIELAADDGYRLAFELDAARHVYVYQQSPAGELVQLFPNDAYSRQENPVVAGERVVLPAEPDGLYVKGQQGEYRLTILAASEPMQELEALYEAYSRRGIRIGRREKLALVEEQLAALSGAQPEGMSVRVLAFEVH